MKLKLVFFECQIRALIVVFNRIMRMICQIA